MHRLSCALLLIVLVATIVLNQSGISSGTLCNPCPPEAELYAALTYSPISEEIAFRITTLGLLVSILTFCKAHSIEEGSPKPRILSLVIPSFLSPGSAKARVGLTTVTSNGRHGIHWSDWILLFLTSSFFGIAVIISGGLDGVVGNAFTAAIL